MRFPFFGQAFRVCPPVCIPGSCFSIFSFPSFRLLLFVCLSLRFFLPFFLSFPLSFPFCFSCFSFCLFFSSLAIRNPSAYADEFRKEEGLDFCFCLCVCLRFCISLFFLFVFRLLSGLFFACFFETVWKNGRNAENGGVCRSGGLYAFDLSGPLPGRSPVGADDGRLLSPGLSPGPGGHQKCPENAGNQRKDAEMEEDGGLCIRQRKPAPVGLKRERLAIRAAGGQERTRLSTGTAG